MNFSAFKRVGTLAIAATFALSVPAVSNVVSKVAPSSFNDSVAHAESSNLMDVNETLTEFHVNHNDEEEHWAHQFNNDGSMQVDGEDFDLTDLKYVVKFPDELSYLLDNEYVTDYLFGNVTNFDVAQNPFNVSGNARDKDDEDEEVQLNKDEHKPYNHISINNETNSVEFDFDSFYSENELEPVIEKKVSGEYIFENLGFVTPIIVKDSDLFDNGTYEFKTAIVRGDSVDLDNVSDAYSEELEVDYSDDPEPEADKEELEELVNDANGYNADDYTDESFEALTAALGEAENVIDDGDADQAEVDAALQELQDAINNLEEPEVNKDELKDLVDDADGYNADEYTDESFEALTATLDEAKEVLDDEDADQDEVDAALQELQDAINNLEEPEADKDELKDLVDDANGYDADDYTDDSFEALTTAVNEAKEVLGDKDADQDEVDAALGELEAAIENMEEVEKEPEKEPEEVNKDELKEFVENLDDYNADSYTDDSFNALAAAFDQAKKTLIDEDADQENVNNALEALQNAVKNLEETPSEPESEVDKSALEELVKDAKAYDADAYSEDSFDALTAAIDKAEKVLDNADADQKEVDAALEELGNAIENLLGSVEADDTDNNASEGDTLPDTATNNPLFILMGVSMVTLGGVLFVVRRKKAVQ